MEHYRRVGIEAKKVEKGVDYGIYHTTFKIMGRSVKLFSQPSYLVHQLFFHHKLVTDIVYAEILSSWRTMTTP